MSEQETNEVEEIKIRLGEDIPVEDETPPFKVEKKKADVVEELRNLGRQFGETMSTAWNSEERQRFESDMRDGLKSFAQEVDKAFKQVKETDAAKRAKEEAEEVRIKIQASDIPEKTMGSLAKGLHWLSQELAKVADNFTPTEKTDGEGERSGEESE